MEKIWGPPKKIPHDSQRCETAGLGGLASPPSASRGLFVLDEPFRRLCLRSGSQLNSSLSQFCKKELVAKSASGRSTISREHFQVKGFGWGGGRLQCDSISLWRRCPILSPWSDLDGQQPSSQRHR